MEYLVHVRQLPTRLLMILTAASTLALIAPVTVSVADDHDSLDNPAETTAYYRQILSDEEIEHRLASGERTAVPFLEAYEEIDPPEQSAAAADTTNGTDPTAILDNVPEASETGSLLGYALDDVPSVGDIPTEPDALLSVTEQEPRLDGLLDISQFVDDARAPKPCAFRTRGDHVRRKDGNARGHGWWENVNCDAERADVFVKLLVEIDDVWYIAATGATKRIKPGTSRRALGVTACLSQKFFYWRSAVDVDLVGYADTGEVKLTEVRPLFCE